MSAATTPRLGAVRGARRKGVSAVWLALMAGPMSFGIAGPALVLPHVAGELGLAITQVTWVVTAFGWAIAVGTPLVAGLQGRLGARVATPLAAVLVLLGAAVTVTGSALPYLAAGSALMGLGTAGLTTIAMSLTISPRAMGLVTASLATTGAIAPLAGELVSGLAGWRAALALPVLAVLGVPLVLRRSPAAPAPGGPTGVPRASGGRTDVPGGSGDPIDVASGSRGRLDVIGMVLLAALVTGLVLIPHAWPAGVGAALAAAVALALWMRARPAGLVPLDVIRAPAFLVAAGLAFALAVVNFGLIYALPPLLAETAGWSGGQVGLAVTWPLLFGGLASYAVIAMSGRVPFAVPAASFVALAAAATATAALSTAPAALLIAQGLASLAAASGQGVFADRARLAVAEERRPAVMGLFNLAYLLGAAFGPAIAALAVS
ncbi:MFS transporter [Nonomuraea candida]|uniref:MFS transporter n=1 Tax=Nonomuraea candida TaxID=359159 RepID=UPI0006945C0F|nr:MFS transporter [Nonomuraea candida]